MVLLQNASIQHQCPHVVPGKNGAKVTLNANGTVTVTNIANKNVKLTYMLNGKKYTTVLKVQKKASGSEGAYKTAGLLK